MSQVSPHVQNFLDIYNAPENRDQGKLTQQALNLLDAIDYSKFDIDEIKVVQDSKDIPDGLAVKILKGWMRRQDDVLLNIRGSVIYQPEIAMQRLQQFYDMMRCPTRQSKNDLIVEDVLYKIATGGGKRSANAVALIDPVKFDNGIIRFYQSEVGNDIKSNVHCLLDFKKDTYYHNKTTQGPYFIIGLPSFMKVRLTSYKLTAPKYTDNRTLQGGPKSWDIFGSNNWNDIKSGNPIKIQSINGDMNLRAAGSEHRYEVDLDDDQYFRYFKFQSTGQNHQTTLEIDLAGFDISGNVITCRD